MIHLEDWTHSPVAKALGWSLIHFLWEGVLIALLLAALLFLCRPGSARLRYALSGLALLAMPLALFITFALSAPGRPTPIPLSRVDVSDAGPLVTGLSASPRSVPIGLKALLPWVPAFWMAGVLAFYLRSVGSWLVARRLLRFGVCAASDDWQARLHRLRDRLQLSKPVVLLESCLVDVPVMMGFLRPVILMPMGLLAGLSTDQVESILIHELAHIRRWDYVANLLQNLVEGLLFYHPAVWWVSGQVRAERENCCDDVVVKLKGDARGYAATLAKLEHNRWPAETPALAATGGSLMKRIRRLLQEQEGRRAPGAPVFVAGLLVVSLGVAVAGWQTKTGAAPKPVIAQPLSAIQSLEVVPLSVSPQPKPEPAKLVAQVQAQPAQEQAATPTTEAARRVRAFDRLRLASQLLSELKTPYQKWLTEDVAYIIADEERAQYKNLQTDEEREKFIEQFWLRRDPTPGTPENEFRDEYYRRIAYANEHFASSIPGWKTDRGRIYMIYGPPDEINSHPSGGAYQRPLAQGGGSTTTFPFEEWRYRFIQGIGNDVVIEFVDQERTGEYHMTNDPSEKDALLYLPPSQREAFLSVIPRTSRQTGTSIQVMGTAAAGGTAVLISIPLRSYGNNAVNLLATVTSLTNRPILNFEQTIPGGAPLFTRFVALPAGSYRLNIVLKDVVTGNLAVDKMDFEVK